MRAVRLPGRADRTAERDNLHIVANPVLLGEHLHQVVFDLLRIRFFRKTELFRDALHMRIHDDGRFPVNVAEDHIRSLPPDSSI